MAKVGAQKIQMPAQPCHQDYVHSPLDETKEKIRLIKIPPRTDLDQIDCAIVTADLALMPSFIALSYMWGPPDRSRDILVNGQRLSVRENLHDFLDAVSRDSRWHEPTRQAYSGFIFIDQICIDQSNVQERNHQVCQMRNIYRAARRVIVWLGVETRTNRRAMSAIENEHRWYGSRRRPLSLLYRSADLTVLTREENIGINQLSTHAYWSRLWVVQEVFLARELVLRWGRKEVPLENAEQVIRDRARLYRWRTEFGLLDVEDAAGLNFLDPVTDYNSDIPAPMLSLLAQRRDYLAGWPLTWAKASEISKCRGCEDPRDQVYGLLGLMRDDTLQVDYGKSLDEVFDDLVAYGVNEQTKDLDAWFSFVNQWRRAAHAERHNLTPESISKHVRVALWQPNDDDSEELSEKCYERKCSSAAIRAGIEGVKHERQQKGIDEPDDEVLVVDDAI